MPPPSSPASRRGWGWVAALLDGSTVPWSDSSAAAEPQLPSFPAAQELESLRRLNLAAEQGGRTVPAALRRELLTTGSTDRNRGDLRLLGEEREAFGPPAVDPTGLPEADLLRVVAGPLAVRLAAHPAPPLLRRRWLARGWHLAGDPWATTYVGHELARQGRSRPGHRAAVLADDYATLAVHSWAAQVVAGGILGLPAWLRGRIRAGALPHRLDLSAHARRMAETVGRSRTLIAVAPAMPQGVRTPAVDMVAVDLARWVGRPLGLLVPAEEKRRLLFHVLIPHTSRDASPTRLPEPWAGRLRTYAEHQRTALRAAGYPVLGSLDRLLPPDPGPAALPTDAAVLARALELLLDPQIGVSS